MLKGLDLSHHNGKCDFHAIKAAGASFVIIKATEHLFEDPMFSHNLAAAKSAELPAMPYHFYRPAGDAVAQVDFFLNTVERENGGDLSGLILPSVDEELDSNERTMSPEEYCHGLNAWLTTFKGRVWDGPVGYTYRDMWQWMGSPDWRQKQYPWIAAYGVEAPPALPGFMNAGEWMFWQYSDNGSWPGVPGDGTVDLDYFNGDESDLQDWIL